MRNFRQLRELELILTWPGSLRDVALSSITSTELQKIIFRAVYINDWKIFVQDTVAWALVDEQLCGLVHRLDAMEYHHTLEVELQLKKPVDSGRYDFTGFLSKFREKGLVAIINGNRVFH